MEQDKKTIFIFDVDGVIDTYSRKAYMDYIFSRSKKLPEKAQLLFMTELKALAIGQVDLRQFELNLQKTFGILPKDVRWLQYYIDNAKPNKEVLNILSVLRAKGNYIVLMSNEDSVRYKIEKDNFKGYADMMFAAADTKLVKPDPAAYKHVVDTVGKKLGMKIEYKDIIFVDDSQRNVEGAAKLGMNAIRFTNADSLRKALQDIEAPKKQAPAVQPEPRTEDTRLKLIRDLFSSYYKRAVDLAPYKIEEREFGVGTPERKIAFRHLNFRNETELRQFVVKEAPQYISYSTGYYRFPSGRPMEMKGWIGGEIVFDLDVTDMNLPCQMVHGKAWICSDCLDAVKKETTKLIEDFLIPDFGFSDKDIAVNFSGNRGYHVHVNDPKANLLETEARREITNYISGIGIDFTEFFPTSGMKGKMLKGPKPDDKGWAGKFARNFLKTLERGVDALVDMGIDRPIANKLYKNKILVEMGIKQGNWDMIYIKNKSEFWKIIMSNQAVAQSDKIDRNVTNDTSHLIRLPNSLHGDTGLIAKKVGSVSNLQKFDPMTDAIAFKGEDIKIKAETKQKLTMNKQNFGPYSGIVKVPIYVGVYLYLKGLAKIDEQMFK